MNPILTALLADCKSYAKAFKKAANEKKNNQTQAKNFIIIKDIIEILDQEVLKANHPSGNPVVEFNDLYNKHFDYFNRFVVVEQRNIQKIINCQQTVEKMAGLYVGIPQETIKRQGKLLVGRKRAVDKWLFALEQRLSSEENQVALEQRFQELLQKANEALTKKGLATISLPTNPTV